MAERINADVGTPDIIVNNAGAGQWKFVDETSPEEAVQMMAVPYFAAFYVTHAFLPGMLRRNTGHIVNVSSVGSRFVWPGATAYIAARWAVRGFTEALRADLAGTKIGVTLFECGGRPIPILGAQSRESGARAQDGEARPRTHVRGRAGPSSVALNESKSWWWSHL